MRWVPKHKLRHDPETLEPIGPQPIAFQLRLDKSPPETYLSVSWVEHVTATPDVQIKTTATLLAKQVHTAPNRGGAFALGNVNAIKIECKALSELDVVIVSTPKKTSPAYGQVWGILNDDLALQSALAFGSWCKIVKACDILKD